MSVFPALFYDACKHHDPTSPHFVDRVLDQFDMLPGHLTEDLHLFSLNDLMAVRSGSLALKLRDLLRLGSSHVTDCVVRDDWDVAISWSSVLNAFKMGNWLFYIWLVPKWFSLVLQLLVLLLGFVVLCSSARPRASFVSSVETTKTLSSPTSWTSACVVMVSLRVYWKDPANTVFGFK